MSGTTLVYQEWCPRSCIGFCATLTWDPQPPGIIAMFENLTEKLQRAFKNLRGQGSLTG